MAIFDVMANLVVTNVVTPLMIVEVDDDIVFGAVKVGHDEGCEMKCCTGPNENLTKAVRNFWLCICYFLGMLKT